MSPSPFLTLQVSFLQVLSVLVFSVLRWRLVFFTPRYHFPIRHSLLFPLRPTVGVWHIIYCWLSELNWNCAWNALDALYDRYCQPSGIYGYVIASIIQSIPRRVDQTSIFLILEVSSFLPHDLSDVERCPCRHHNLSHTKSLIDAFIPSAVCCVPHHDSGGPLHDRYLQCE